MAYYFRLPKITDLTIEQQYALNELNPIALSGGAGTGKSVVSLWRHIQNVKVLKKSSILMTYTRSLQVYLHYCAKSESIEASKKVHTAIGWLLPENSYAADEIIVDEAQDLPSDKLERIKNFAEQVSYGADNNQRLYQQGMSEDELRKLFPSAITYTLYQNFRNSYHILRFANSILPNITINRDTLEDLKIKNIGLKPILCIGNTEQALVDKIVSIIKDFQSETHNIVILVPFGNMVDRYFSILTSAKILCSRYHNGLNTMPSINNVHITTFKSSKGLEFDTVIIPEFENFRDWIQNSQITRTEDKDYYVALTRAKSNLYLTSSHELDFLHKDTYEMEMLK